MPRPFIDLTGQRFGKLIVLERAVDLCRARRSMWWVQCDCGSERKAVNSGPLRAGKTASCGCTWRKPRIPAEERAAKRAAYMRGWNERNRPAVKERQREWLAKNRGKVRDYYLAQYGLTREEFNTMLADQGGCCAICESPSPGPKQWHVDHCHKTGRVRGVLCHHCNIGLGHFRDDANLVASAAEYLRRAESTDGTTKGPPRRAA